MSAKISGQVWDLDLPQRELLVLLAITDHANHEGAMWPGVALVAWKTGYSQRTVQRVMNNLVHRGILTRRVRPGKETIYTANFDAAPKKAPRPKKARKRKSGDIAMTGDTAMSVVTSLRVVQNPTPDTVSANVHDEPSLKDQPSLLQQSAVFRAYESVFGFTLTPFMAQELKSLAEDYTVQWVVDALKVAATNEKRTLAYVKGVLRRWEHEGRHKKQTEQPAAPRVLSDIERAALDKAREADQRQWWEEQGLL